MNGTIPASFNADAAERIAVSHALIAFAVALAAGALALVSPLASLVAIAFLATRALMRAENAPQQLDLVSLAGPALGACIVGSFVGLAGAVGVLFVWRLQADVRWSLSEARRLAIARGSSSQATWRSLAHGWTTPACALALVAFSAPHVIAGLPLDLPHAPVWVPLAAGAIALLVTGDWLLRRAADWRLGEVAVAPSVHMLTHHALFMLAFGAMFDLSAGIVALAAWRLVHAAPFKSAPFRSAQFKSAQASLTAVP